MSEIRDDAGFGRLWGMLSRYIFTPRVDKIWLKFLLSYWFFLLMLPVFFSHHKVLCLFSLESTFNHFILFEEIEMHLMSRFFFLAEQVLSVLSLTLNYHWEFYVVYLFVSKHTLFANIFSPSPPPLSGTYILSPRCINLLFFQQIIMDELDTLTEARYIIVSSASFIMCLLSYEATWIAVTFLNESFLLIFHNANPPEELKSWSSTYWFYVESS